MPQMSPMLWLPLFIYFNFILLLFIIMIYYFFLPPIPTPAYPSIYVPFNAWKW
uniref:ATP synthase F0 subunit 8 n=1 Tax=Blasticotoma filiceti TaxID=1141352 RepID=UPI002206C436|nr:ATP synthase F0 subunit 8 [Blasticotoma filiceti]UXW93441.1 ATP synthase F0 subunit 8 [Blasticotoma filiceti]